ncbi:hypothetical protein F4818DRAFT_433384 [Hypoxylon cercidicola]|nr:hypothetical protein F4818DRAFT_433384 [Hypoxylon cercidicola]
MQFRKNSTSVTEDSSTTIGSQYNHIITVTDTLTGYSKRYHEEPTVFTERHERPQAETDKKNPLVECDTFANTRCFDPIIGAGCKPPLRPVYNYSVLGSGIDSSTSRFDDKSFSEQFGPITRVTLHAGSWIDGIEVFYGGRSSGLRGTIGGLPLTLHLTENEVITEMGGNVGDSHVVAFWIRTNFGNEIGGRGPPGTKDNFYLTYGSPNPVRPYNTRVAYFSGMYQSTRIDQLKVGWASYQP